MRRFKRHKNYSFWNQDLRLSRISKLGDPLEKLNTGVCIISFSRMWMHG